MNIHKPSDKLLQRINRRFIRFEARRSLPVRVSEPIVSFRFDDCPQSVMDEALVPLEAEGWQGTVYIAAGLCGTTNHLGKHMVLDDVRAAYNSGHEIGNHTFSHCDATEHDLDFVLEDINRNEEALADIGIPRCETFAYPYGAITAKLKKALETRFRGSRGIRSWTHRHTADLNQIASHRLYHGSDFDLLINRIARLQDQPGWMTIFTHDVRENPSEFGCTPAQMRAAIRAVKDSGARVLPVAEAIRFLEASA